MINKSNTQFLKCLLIILIGISANAQTRVDIINSGFESGVKGWENITVDNSEFYAPVEGDWYAVQKNDGSKTYQRTGRVIKRGETYTVKLWARSINPAGDSAKTIAEISMLFNSTTIVSAEKNVNAPQLKGAAAVYPNDDGANVWVDGNFRHEFADYHLYQPVSYDPIKDPWLLVKGSSYRKLKGFGWAVGSVIVGGRKFIYGTLYRDKPENFYSSVTLTKVLTTNGYNYTWSKPVTVLSQSKTEIPWVEDLIVTTTDQRGNYGWLGEAVRAMYPSWIRKADCCLVTPPMLNLMTCPKRILRLLPPGRKPEKDGAAINGLNAGWRGPLYTSITVTGTFSVRTEA